MPLPVFQTSANRSGEPAPAGFDAIDPRILEAVDLAIDGGELGGEPSTVVDVSALDRGGEWKVLREGALHGRRGCGPPRPGLARLRREGDRPHEEVPRALELGAGSRSMRSSERPWTPAMISTVSASFSRLGGPSLAAASRSDTTWRHRSLISATVRLTSGSTTETAARSK